MVTLAVKVHPRAKKNAITGAAGDVLKVSLTAPPIDSKANDACVEFLAKVLKVPRSSISIAAGHSSRNKVIQVTGLSADEAEHRIGVYARTQAGNKRGKSARAT
jgi:uncharacterized protein